MNLLSASTFLPRNYSDDSEGHSYGQLVIGSFITTMCSLMQNLFGKTSVTQVTQPPYSPDLVLCNFWLFPRLKSTLKDKRYQTISEIQENTTVQLMAIGRTV